MRTVAGPAAKAAPRIFVPRFHAAARKVHTYLGLLNLTLLVVFGIVGLIAAAAEGEYKPPPVESERDLSYTPPPNAGNAAIAADVYRFLRPPLASPPGPAAARRDPRGNIVVTFYTANGPIQATIFAQEHRLHVVRRRNSLGQFLSNIHSATMLDASGTRDWRLRAWTWYTEFAIWSLAALAQSGPLIWLVSRRRYRLAWFTFGGNAALSAALYFLVR